MRASAPAAQSHSWPHLVCEFPLSSSGFVTLRLFFNHGVVQCRNTLGFCCSANGCMSKFLIHGQLRLCILNIQQLCICGKNARLLQMKEKSNEAVRKYYRCFIFFFIIVLQSRKKQWRRALYLSKYDNRFVRHLKWIPFKPVLPLLFFKQYLETFFIILFK